MIDEEIAELKRSAQLAPEDVPLRLRLAGALVRAGRRRDALVALSPGVWHAPEAWKIAIDAWTHELVDVPVIGAVIRPAELVASGGEPLELVARVLWRAGEEYEKCANELQSRGPQETCRLLRALGQSVGVAGGEVWRTARREKAWRYAANFVEATIGDSVQDIDEELVIVAAPVTGTTRRGLLGSEPRVVALRRAIHKAGRGYVVIEAVFRRADAEPLMVTAAVVRDDPSTGSDLRREAAEWTQLAGQPSFVSVLPDGNAEVVRVDALGRSRVVDRSETFPGVVARWCGAILSAGSPSHSGAVLDEVRLGAGPDSWIEGMAREASGDKTVRRVRENLRILVGDRREPFAVTTANVFRVLDELRVLEVPHGLPRRDG
jgi:hypothetical protein